MKFKRNKRADRKYFQKTVNSVHAKNVSGYRVPRGGVRL